DPRADRAASGGVRPLTGASDMQVSSQACVSVVIPCFNAGETIAVAVDSVLAQTDAHFDILVIDDGSTDGSLEITRRFEQQVRVLTGSNRGASAARNRGIADTTSEWLLFLDADDLLLPGTLINRLDAAAATGADV